MALQTLNTIKQWFKTGLKPSQAQFWDTWDSFRHKYEKIPVKDIDELDTILNTKADKSQLQDHKTDIDAHVGLFNKKEDKANKGIASGYVPLDEFTKITAQYLTIVNDLVTGGTTSLLSAQQGVILQSHIDSINKLLTSDNINLNTIQKIVDTIEQIQISLNTILVNDLTTGGITKALTAEMGKILNDKITAGLNNIKREILIDTPLIVSRAEFATIINSLPSFTITDFDLPYFVTTMAEDVNGYKVELIGVGKGTYGTGGTSISSSQIRISALGVVTSGTIPPLQQVLEVDSSATVDTSILISASKNGKTSTIEIVPDVDTIADIGVNINSDAKIEISGKAVSLNASTDNNIDLSTVGTGKVLYNTFEVSTKNYADTKIVGLFNDRGSYNASSNEFPISGGSGVGGAILRGDTWFLSAGGILGGVNSPSGSNVRALIDSPTNNISDWNILAGGGTTIPNLTQVLTAGSTAIVPLAMNLNYDDTINSIKYYSSHHYTGFINRAVDYLGNDLGQSSFNKDRISISDADNTTDIFSSGMEFHGTSGSILLDGVINPDGDSKNVRLPNYNGILLTTIDGVPSDNVGNINLGSLINGLVSKTTPVDADQLVLMDSADSNKSKKLSWANIKTTLTALYVTQATAQTISGVKTFLNGTLGFRNAANTFTSFFLNTNTAARTYTFQNRDGTILDSTDLTTINAAIAAKQTVFTGIANYLPKSTNASAMTPSRIQDTGTYIGIDVINSPLKDLSFGNQANRIIGVELSDSSNKGKDLTIDAGSTVNYSLNSDFVSLAQTALMIMNGIQYAPNGNMYLTVASGAVGGLYRQTALTGNFTRINAGFPQIQCIAITASNNIYTNGLTGAYLNQVLKMTNATGNFVDTGFTLRAYGHFNCLLGDNTIYATPAGGGGIYKFIEGTDTDFNLVTGITARTYKVVLKAPNGDVYATLASSGDVYVQYGGTGDFIGLNQVQRLYSTGTISPTGNVYLMSGNDMYVKTTTSSDFVKITGITPRLYTGVASTNLGDLYSFVNGVDIYKQINYNAGIANLDGGTMKVKSGTGKGIGSSRIEFHTGQKTVSGTDMQVQTLRAYIDENGYFTYLAHPTYANDAAADADTNLPSKAFYKITGNRTLYQKP